MTEFTKGKISFDAKNLRSVGQRAAKLLAVKVGGLKKKSVARPWPHLNHSVAFKNAWGQIILKVSWLVTLQPFNLQRFTLPLWKDLNFLCYILSDKETGSIIKIDFALSK